MSTIEYAPDELPLANYAERAYLDYALMTVKGRALPEIADGQKVVQRRILFAMNEMGLLNTVKPVKSARVVGEVLGKYHPHGDTAAYDAAVRMAQEFTLRYPLILRQGNFGSRDGESAAAMRYTEMRLSPLASLLLAELRMGTVDFIETYDGSFEEPSLLPARLPMLLLNGAKGIAVGLATEIPPHNLREIANAAAALVENPALPASEVLKFIEGPDFPDGAQVTSSRAEIERVYEAGEGSLRCRAVWKREELARGQWQIVVTALPYQVSSSSVLHEIEELTNPQVKTGKKSLDQRQLQLKQVALEFLDTVRDESGQISPVRLVFEPKTSKVDEGQMMAFLLANTSLERSVPVNMTALCLDGRPRTVGIDVMLREWAEFRVRTVRRRTQFLLDEATQRVGVVEGRLIAYRNLDAVIRTIRDAEDPKGELQTRFGLTADQSEDILNMRVRQLNKLESVKLEKELEELRKEQARLSKLLASEGALRKLIVQEIHADALKYGDDRRTLLKEEARSTTLFSAQTVVDEEVTLVLSANLWFKAYKGHELPADAFAFKAGDQMLFKVEARTTSPIYVLDTTGRAYAVKGSDAPVGRGEGVPLSTLLELQNGARIAAVLTGLDSTRYLFAGQHGYGYVAPLSSLASERRAGKAFLKLKEGEVPLPPVALPQADEGFVVCGASDGRMLAFPLEEVKTLSSGGQGVILMATGEGTILTAAQFVQGAPFEGRMLVKGAAVPVKLSGADWERHLGKRARKGALLPKKGVLTFANE